MLWPPRLLLFCCHQQFAATMLTSMCALSTLTARWTPKFACQSSVRCPPRVRACRRLFFERGHPCTGWQFSEQTGERSVALPIVMTNLRRHHLVAVRVLRSDLFFLGRYSSGLQPKKDLQRWMHCSKVMETNRERRVVICDSEISLPIDNHVASSSRL